MSKRLSRELGPNRPVEVEGAALDVELIRGKCRAGGDGVKNFAPPRLFSIPSLITYLARVRDRAARPFYAKENPEIGAARDPQRGVQTLCVFEERRQTMIRVVITCEGHDGGYVGV